jgi:hypothetical protein
MVRWGIRWLLLILLVWSVNYTWRRPIASSGGVYFGRKVELPLPLFRQADARWRNDLLGCTPASLAAEGCAVASAAMVLTYYGVDTDPQRLNQFVTEVGGYTPQGWIYWEAASALAPERVRHVYEDAPSYFWIDWNLWRGNPVIIRLKIPRGGNHFVVIVGKQGWDYLILDPGAGAAKGVYPLRELTPKIQALRFYRQLAWGK